VASPWFAAASIVGGLALLHLAFVARSGLNLDFEEAQYWLWAQAPAWGYWSKPPVVAWLIAATTAVCGDAAPCVRLASPLLHAGTALVLGALGAALGGARLGFWAAIAYGTLPGVALSSVLITTDVPLLFCWTLALLAFVRVLETDRWQWAAVCGLAFGMGMQSKYSMLLFAPCAGVYCLLGGRRPRARHLVLFAGVAAVVMAPNIAWNFSNGFGTVRHTLSRVRPGASTLRPVEATGFMLAQFAVFGPLLLASLLGHELRFWRRPADDRRLLLGAFTFPPLALAIVVGVVARANANWAAPAYVAGTVLVAWSLLRRQRLRLLRLSVAVNAGLGLLLYGMLSTLPAVALPDGRVIPVAARLLGWDRLGWRVAARAAELGDARVLVDRRELLAIAGYYGGVPDARLVEWNPGGVPHSQFQLRTHIAAGDPGPFLFVSYRPRPAGVTRRFEHVELLETVVVPLARGLERTHWLFVLSGFRGYEGRGRRRAAFGPPRRSASSPPRSTAASVLCPGKIDSPTRCSPGASGPATIDQ
jgi:hypothetical protein